MAQPGSSLTRYLVEVARPDGGWAGIQALAARSRAATSELRREGMQVRFVRTIYVPEDDLCLLLCEARSERALREAMARVPGAVRHVVETIRLEAPQDADGPPTGGRSDRRSPPDSSRRRRP